MPYDPQPLQDSYYNAVHNDANTYHDPNQDYGGGSYYTDVDDDGLSHYHIDDNVHGDDCYD